MYRGHRWPRYNDLHFGVLHGRAHWENMFPKWRRSARQVILRDRKHAMYALEKSIDFDLNENANFAFSWECNSREYFILSFEAKPVLKIAH